MSDEMRTDDPEPVGPLGAAMADLVQDPPPAAFTAWSVIGEVRRRRSVRRQVAGGLAAGVAAIGVLVTVGLATVGGAGSDTATSAMPAAGAATSASVGAALADTRSSSAAAMLSSSSASSGSESAAGGSAFTPGPSVVAAPDGGNAPELSSAQGEPGSGGGETCAPSPLSPGQLTLIADRLPGLTPQTSCATDDVQLAVQDYTVDAAPGVTLRAEALAGTFDPCAQVGEAACVDVGAGVRSTTRARGTDLATLVWTSGPAESTVLTLTVPADTAAPLTVDELAAVVTALAATR